MRLNIFLVVSVAFLILIIYRLKRKVKTTVQCLQTETNCSGVCSNLNTDSNNCGSCGTICSTGLTCCNGSCVNLSSNKSFCGSCDIDCIYFESVGNLQRCCSGLCKNIDQDRDNCGNCGNVCSDPSMECHTGMCA